MELRVNDIRLRRIDQFNFGVEKMQRYSPKAEKMAGKEYAAWTLYYNTLERALESFVDQLGQASFVECKDASEFLREYQKIRETFLVELRQFKEDVKE